MSQKKAKKMRKEIRKQIDEENLVNEAYLPPIPLAGCPMCNHKLWYVRLDQPPPNHEVIVSIICGNHKCNQQIGINLDIEEHARRQETDTDDVSIGQICQECGFEVHDCQCEELES